MSRRGIIEAEPPQQCDGCGQIRELRPYGVGGSKVCEPCARANPDEAEHRMHHHLFGECPSAPPCPYGLGR